MHDHRQALVATVVPTGTECNGNAQVDAVRNRVLWLNHADGRVSIEEGAGGVRTVTVHANPGIFVSRRACSTDYPVALIEKILSVKSVGHVCDEIARHQDPNYVEKDLRYALLAYVPLEGFRGKRLLDFGSGSGASSLVLASMLPDTEIVGVELDESLINVARMRADLYGGSKLVFHRSPSPEELPADLGRFHFILLSAVYEHLLPHERVRLPAQLWAHLELHGVFFVNELPFRFYPIESHTTGLPLLNYLPDRWAHAAARRFAPMVAPDATWEELLRRGIRGGTAPEIRRNLLRRGGAARMLPAAAMGFDDHSSLWFACSYQARPHALKRVMRPTFRILSDVCRSPVAPFLSLAFEKLA